MIYFIAVIAIILFLIYYFYPRKYSNSLKSKKKLNVVITGGSKGIGAAITKEFLNLGHNLVICARDTSNLKATENFNFMDCDVTFPKDVENFVNFAFEKLGTVDIWLNNAGVSGTKAKSFEEASDDELKNVIEINLLGSMYCCKYVLIKMKKQNYGHICNMEGFGSRGEKRGERLIDYGTSKYGLTYLTDSLIQSTKNTNIGIHKISPGMAVTDLLMKGSIGNPSVTNILNILADEPKVIASYLVPEMVKLEGTGKRIAFLTPLGVVWRFLTFFLRKNRFFNEKGDLIKKLD